MSDSDAFLDSIASTTEQLSSLKIDNMSDPSSGTAETGTAVGHPQHDSPASSIYKLYPNIILQIFSLNADPEDDAITQWRLKKPNEDYEEADRIKYRSLNLNVLRYSSQVCRVWREIIVHEAPLWGRALNFDLLCQEEGDWREEVLRRTGDSPLHIRSTNSVTHLLNPEPQAEVFAFHFLLSVLDSHWERVHSLEVTLAVEDELLVRELLHLLHRPASSLRSFIMNISLDISWDENRFPRKMENIFLGHAPHLHTFRSTGLFLKLKATWAQQLVDLKIDNDRGVVPEPLDARHLSVSQVWDAVGTMPLLETLEIKKGVQLSLWESLSTRRKPPTLLHLKQLYLDLDGSVCFWLLQGLEIHNPDCVLNISVDMRNNYVDITREWTSICRIFKQHTERYLKFYAPYPMQASIFIDRPYAGIGIGGELWLTAALMNNTKVASHYVPLLISQIPTWSIGHITEVTFSCETVWLNTFGYSALSHISPLPIETLDIDVPGLHALNFLIASSPPVLSELRTVSLQNMEAPDGWTASEIILTFLRSCAEAGNPITTVNLLGSAVGPWHTLDYFDEMTGMRLIWHIQAAGEEDEIHEYICGSGDPQVRTYGWHSEEDLEPVYD